MKKKNVAVMYVLSCDDYAFTVATSIMSMEDTNPGLVDNYIIFCDENDLTKEAKDCFFKITEKIIFINFTKEYICKLIKTNDVFNNIFTYVVYTRVFCIDYLKEYKNVLILDSDVQIVDDIRDLFDYGPLAWKPTTLPLNTFVEGITFDKVYTKPNGGVILMTDELTKYSSQDLIDIFNKYTYTGPPDEFVYGMFAYLKNIKSNLLATYNRFLDSTNLNEAKIIHGMKCKYWRYNVTNVLLPKFDTYYQKWLSLGGSGYNGIVEGPAGFPKEKHKIFSYLLTIDTHVRLNTALYKKLPSTIRPSLAVYSPRLPYFIMGKNEKIFYYYIHYIYKRAQVHIGITYRGKITDNVRSLFDILRSETQFNISEPGKGIYLYKEYFIKRTIDNKIDDKQLLRIANGLLDFIDRTLHIVTCSQLGDTEISQEEKERERERERERIVGTQTFPNKQGTCKGQKEAQCHSELRRLEVYKTLPRGEILVQKAHRQKGIDWFSLSKPQRSSLVWNSCNCDQLWNLIEVRDTGALFAGLLHSSARGIPGGDKTEKVQVNTDVLLANTRKLRSFFPGLPVYAR